MNNSRGTAMLEYALVMPVLILFVLGAYDVSRYLEVRQAVRTAADISARCVYPTDAACLQVAAAPPSRLFDWYQTSFSTDILWSKYNYSGDMYWRELDQSLFYPRATVLDQVTYPVVRTNFVARKATNNIISQGYTWSLDYAYRNFGFPQINPGDPYEYPTVRNPATGNSVSPNQSIGGPSTSGNWFTNTSSVQLAQVSFSIPAPNLPIGTDCYAPQGNYNNQGNPGYQGARCRNSWPNGFTFGPGQNELEDHTYIVLRVTGSGEAEGTSQGRVTMRLDGGGSSVDLSGQVYGGSWQQQNFWVRGMPGNPGKVQFEEYPISGSGNGAFHAPIKVKYGQNYTLRFFIEKSINANNSDRVRYDVDNIDLWYPKYKSKHASGSCPQLPLGQSPNQSNCPGSPLNAVYAPDPNNVTYAIDTQNICAADATGVQSALNAMVPAVIPDSSGYNIVDTGSVCFSGNLSNSCPPIGQNGNYGTNFSFQQKAAICPPVGTDIGNPTPSGWTAAVRAIPAQAGWITNPAGTRTGLPFTEDCVNTHPAPVGNLALYENAGGIDWSDSELLPTKAVYSGDPLAPSAPSCAALQQVEFPEDFPNLHITHPTTNFLGDQSSLGCGYEALLETEAETIARDTSTYVPDLAKFIGTAVAARTYEVRASYPADSCTAYREDVISGTTTMLAGGPYLEGTTPAACQSDPTSCYSAFNSYVPGYTPPGPILDKNAAQNLGFAALQAAVPRAQLGCSGDNCATLNLSDPVNGMINSTWSYKLPLTVLAGSPITVVGTISERLESEFSKQ